MLAAVAILSSAAFHACDESNPFGIFVSDAVLTTTTGANLRNDFDSVCDSDCDGDPGNDRQVTTYNVTGTYGEGVSLQIDNIYCGPSESVGGLTSGEIEEALVAAINGEDLDCGPENTYVTAELGSIVLQGLFGGWYFYTNLANPTSESSITGPGNDAYSVAELLTDLGWFDGWYALEELADQVTGDDLWPAQGPFSFFGSTTVNCNSTGGDEGDASAGTFTETSIIQGVITPVEPAVRDAPGENTPPGSETNRTVHTVTYNGCQVTGDFWGDSAEETVTLNGSTSLTVEYDPPIPSDSAPLPDSETAKFVGSVRMTTSEGSTNISLRVDGDGWWWEPNATGGFCFGGAVLSGEDDTDSLDDGCTGDGVFIPAEFVFFGIPYFGPE